MLISDSLFSSVVFVTAKDSYTQVVSARVGTSGDAVERYRFGEGRAFRR